MFSAMHNLLTGTEMFYTNGSFGEKRHISLGLLFLHAVPKCIHQETKAALQNVYFSPSHDTDPQKLENIFPGRLECGSAAVNLSKSNNQCILFHEKDLYVWRVEFGGLNSVLFFFSTCSV